MAGQWGLCPRAPPDRPMVLSRIVGGLRWNHDPSCCGTILSGSVGAMIGQTISHYKITEKLGEGGMGVVYKAEDTKLKRPVALKFLSPHLLSDTETKERFIREAQAAAALNHPNICTVHEIDEAAGRTFIVMAFLEGASLDTKIEAGPLKLNEALDFAIQTVQGLQAAHGKKIVHRDIKPANLMVTPQGAKQLVTIMDFGLAQLTDRSKLTQGPTALGTVSYMSPEQTQGMELDHRTDLWALGAVIYEMVTGQRAFQGHYDQAITYSIQHEEPEPMTALRTGVPMELERIADKCLVKNGLNCGHPHPLPPQQPLTQHVTISEVLGYTGHSSVANARRYEGLVVFISSSLCLEGLDAGP